LIPFTNIFALNYHFSEIVEVSQLALTNWSLKLKVINQISHIFPNKEKNIIFETLRWSIFRYICLEVPCISI